MDVSGQLNKEKVGSSSRKIRSFSRYEKSDEVFHSDQSHIVVVHNGQLRVQTGDCTIDVAAENGVRGLLIRVLALRRGIQSVDYNLRQRTR